MTELLLGFALGAIIAVIIQRRPRRMKKRFRDEYPTVAPDPSWPWRKGRAVQRRSAARTKVKK